MFDERMRTVKDMTFDPVARMVQAIPPLFFSLAGLVVGVLAAIALWQQLTLLGLLLWLLNRVFDGLDGAVARLSARQTDLGGYLDILADYLIYALVPIGLAAGFPGEGVIAALLFLLASFYVNSASWMYLAALLEKRDLAHSDRLTSITMPAGLVGGTETILFYIIFILFPQQIYWLFPVMAALVSLTILQRLVWAQRHLD